MAHRHIIETFRPDWFSASIICTLRLRLDDLGLNKKMFASFPPNRFNLNEVWDLYTTVVKMWQMLSFVISNLHKKQDFLL